MPRTARFDRILWTSLLVLAGLGVFAAIAVFRFDWISGLAIIATGTSVTASLALACRKRSILWLSPLVVLLAYGLCWLWLFLDLPSELVFAIGLALGVLLLLGLVRAGFVSVDR